MGAKKSMAVIRGTREAVIKFYENFEKLDVKFIAGSKKPYQYKSIKGKFNFINVGFYKPLGIDPASIFKQYGNLSWIFFKDLEKHLEGCGAINISDTYYFYNLQAVAWAKRNNVPVVCIVWTNIANHITSWFPPYSYVTKKVIEGTNLFILRNKKALDFTDSLNISRNKVKVIYKGIDLEKFHSPFTSRHSQFTNILFTGNLSRAKGLDDLLAVFTEIRSTNPNIQLIIAGDGEMRRYVEKLHREGMVDYRGFLEYDSLAKVYQEADIYCAPSKEQKFLGLKLGAEYFSYSLMEAQAVGLPIVATNIGGIPEEVGKDNLLVEPGDRGGLQKALEKLIKNKSLRKSIGLRNRKRAERIFDVTKQARKTEEAILSIL